MFFYNTLFLFRYLLQTRQLILTSDKRKSSCQKQIWLEGLRQSSRKIKKKLLLQQTYSLPILIFHSLFIYYKHFINNSEYLYIMENTKSQETKMKKGGKKIISKFFMWGWGRAKIKMHNIYPWIDLYLTYNENDV